MIQVTKEEMLEIRKKLRDEHITICNRQSSARKKTYYVSESFSVMKILNDIRSGKKIVHYE